MGRDETWIVTSLGSPFRGATQTMGRDEIWLATVAWSYSLSSLHRRETDTALRRMTHE